MPRRRTNWHHRQRDFGVSNGCDNVIYSNGLLPDRMGRKVLMDVDRHSQNSW